MLRYRSVRQMKNVDDDVYIPIEEMLRRHVLSDINNQRGFDNFIDQVYSYKKRIDKIINNMSKPISERYTYCADIAYVTEAIKVYENIIAEYDRIVAELLAEGYITCL